MDKRQCKRCCVIKALEDFKDTNKYCERCLEKEREKYHKNREKKREKWQKYYTNNKTEILEKKKEYKKDYMQLEVFCDYCQCKVKQCRWSKHLQTEKHKQNETVKNDEEEKISKMTEEEKDEYLKMKKLKQIWKTVWLRS